MERAKGGVGLVISAHVMAETAVDPPYYFRLSHLDSN